MIYNIQYIMYYIQNIMYKTKSLLFAHLECQNAKSIISTAAKYC
jgi:hypothetical protein